MIQTPTESRPKVEFAPGTPNWVDMGSPDIEATRRFYTGLFGWTAQVGSPETGGYTMFLKNGAPVAGAGPQQEGDTQPPHWGGYIATADADATAAQVQQAGGRVVMAPMDVMQFGRMAIFADPEGAVFGVWQGREMSGAGLVNSPGAMTWLELLTHQPDQAGRFYPAVFDWSPTERQMAEGGTYTMWRCAGKPVAGMFPLGGVDWGADVTAQWVVYFEVEDCDGTVAHARELGADVMAGPRDIEPGRFAMIRDPQGVSFAIIAMDPDFVP